MRENGLSKEIYEQLKSKLTTELSKEQYRTFYQQIIDYFKTSLDEIENNFYNKLEANYNDLPIPVIVQSYLTQEEYKEYKENKKNKDTQKNIFPMTNYSIENNNDDADYVIDSVLEFNKINDDKYIFDFLCIENDLKDIEDKLNKLLKKSKVKFKIEKCDYFYEVAKEFITCVLINQQNILPYLPLNEFVYRIEINSKNENLIKDIQAILEDNECVVNPILIWNVEKKIFPITAKRSFYFDDRHFTKVDIDDINENSHPYFVTDIDTVQKSEDNIYTIMFESNKNIEEIVYYQINNYENFINELSTVFNNKPYYYNKLKNSLLPKNTVKTKAEIEIFFNLFEQVDNIKLVDVQVDDNELYVKKSSIFNYNYNIFYNKKKCKVILKVEPASKLKTWKDKLFFSYNANFLATILDDYLPGYWCEVELKYE